MPQIFCGRSSPMPYSKARSRLANTTRAPADLPVSGTWTVIRAPNSNGPVVLTKAPCRFTTIVSPSHDSPVACTSMRTRIGTRVLRRRSLRRSLLALVIAPLQGIPSGPHSPLFSCASWAPVEGLCRACLGSRRPGARRGSDYKLSQVILATPNPWQHKPAPCKSMSSYRRVELWCGPVLGRMARQP